jgi:hypothetical protein
MTFVKCSVDGYGARLQPIAKPLRDKENWVYRECDRCLRPVCEEHFSEVGDEIVCDRCRRNEEAQTVSTDLIDLKIKRST